MPTQIRPTVFSPKFRPAIRWCTDGIYTFQTLSRLLSLTKTVATIGRQVEWIDAVFMIDIGPGPTSPDFPAVSLGRSSSLVLAAVVPFPNPGSQAVDTIMVDAIPVLGQFAVFLGHSRLPTELARDISETASFSTVHDSTAAVTRSRRTCTKSTGDTDGDGELDFADFLSLSANFGKNGSWVKGDFDNDETVRFGDSLLLSAGFSVDQSN